jgi:CBS domain-containing protein
MLCKDVMKTELVYCSPEAPVTEAAMMMRQENVGFIPICDTSRKPLGTLTDRDIVVHVIAERRSLDIPCREAMTKVAITCRPDQKLDDALEQMKEHQISRMMCVDEQGCLVGVFSLSDVAKHESNRAVADTIRGVTDREAKVH